MHWKDELELKLWVFQMHNLGRTGVSSQYAVLETFYSRPYWLLIQFIHGYLLDYNILASDLPHWTFLTHIILQGEWACTWCHIALHTDSYYMFLWMSFNGLRSDSHISTCDASWCLLHKGLIGHYRDMWVFPPKFTQNLLFKVPSLSLSLFFWSYFPLVLCFACL